MYLVLEPESAGYVVLGPTLELLEAVHPRLPVTFFDLFTHALNRWVSPTISLRMPLPYGFLDTRPEPIGARLLKP
jgi:hypothetical protein